MMRRDRPRSAPYIAALLSVAQEHGISIWLAAGTFYEGWLRWSTADREASMAAMHKGMALLRSQQQGAFMPMFMTRLAETEAEAGHPDAVLASVDMQLEVIEQTGQRWYLSELHRVRGEMF
jgi:predicted ATPase